jgi:hypothetical protein
VIVKLTPAEADNRSYTVVIGLVGAHGTIQEQ